MPHILIVEDEDDMLQIIAYNLERAGHTVTQARCADEALAALAETSFDLIISDIMMPGMDGLAFCTEVRSRPATMLTPFLFVTAKGQSEDKYRGLSAGADDYIPKPFELADLLARVNGRLQHRERMARLEREISSAHGRWAGAYAPEDLRAVRDETVRLTDEVQQAGYLDYAPATPDAAALRNKVKGLAERYPRLAELRRTVMIGESRAYLEIFEDLLIAANDDDATLLYGETGTGKTAAAEAVWQLSARRDQPFCTVSCSEFAAADPTIAMGKLFGYGKNSGLPNLPAQGQAGLLAQADGGVLFLDEVTTLPAAAQAMLLLPLEGRSFRPAVGTGGEQRVNVKFILATNRDLSNEVAAGRFPRDLYERIAGETIRLPPLRERGDDIGLLAEHFVAELAGADQSSTLTTATHTALAAYPWPGNVREHRRCVRHAYRRAALQERIEIEPTDLPEAVRQTPPPVTAGDQLPGFSNKDRAALRALRATGFRIGDAEAQLGLSQKSRTLSHRLRGLGLKALSAKGWDVEAAARLLAGNDESLTATVTRRLNAQLDHLEQTKDDPDEKQLSHLLVEHRPFVLEGLARCRSRCHIISPQK